MADNIETTQRRTTSRLWRVAMAGAAATCLAASGCSAGQITQTATQVAAVNGASAEKAGIALRNVFIGIAADAPPTNRAELKFYAINTGEEPDRLLAIESEGATVTLEADPAKLLMQPGTALAAGEPIQQLEKPKAPDKPITATVELADGTVQPGLTMEFTFVFERAGEIPITVPFDVYAPGEDVQNERPLPAAGT